MEGAVHSRRLPNSPLVQVSGQFARGEHPMRNSATRRRVLVEFAELRCGNRSVNASQPFDNPRDIWWAHKDLNLGPTDYECFPGSNSIQRRPTKPNKNQGKPPPVSGLNCSPSAGVLGQFSDSDGAFGAREGHKSPVTGQFPESRLHGQVVSNQ